MSPAARRWWRAAGAAAVAAFAVAVARFWHPVWGLTPLIQFDAAFHASEIPELRSQPVYVYRDTGAYDGVAYAQLAYHPLLGSPALARALDNPAYRARRILPSALAWLLAGGRDAAIIQVYAALNIAAWIVLAAILWRLLAVRDFCTWLAWAGLLFSAGALASVRFSLTDLPALLLVACAVAAAERGRGGRGVGWLAAAGLCRETSFVALPAALGRPWISRSNAGRAAAALAPWAAWALYVRWRLGPDQAAPGNFAWPLAAFAAKWRDSLLQLGQAPDRLLAAGTLLAVAGLTVQAAYLLRHRDPSDPWWRLGAAGLLLMLLLGPAVWEGFPGAAPRVLLPMGLAFAVLASRRRAAGWLIAGNLGILAGVLALRYVPFDNREIAAARRGGEAVQLRVDGGWAFTEQHRWHIWSWSNGPAHLQLRAWPAGLSRCRLDFFLRSLGNRTVTIREDGRVLWSGTVGRDRRPVSLQVRINEGSAKLDFGTDRPAVTDPGPPHKRRLAFALYDPRIELP